MVSVPIYREGGGRKLDSQSIRSLPGRASSFTDDREIPERGFERKSIFLVFEEHNGSGADLSDQPFRERGKRRCSSESTRTRLKIVRETHL